MVQRANLRCVCVHVRSCVVYVIHACTRTRDDANSCAITYMYKCIHTLDVCNQYVFNVRI